MPNPSVVDSIYVNIYLKNYFAYAENDEGSGVRHPTDVISAGFQSQLEASREFSNTEELRSNETVCLWMKKKKNIYIYISRVSDHSGR